MERYYTSDGVEIAPNLRVFGHDGKWGNVDPKEWSDRKRELRCGVFAPSFDGWFDVILDGGGRALYNGDRMAHHRDWYGNPDPNPTRRL